MIPRYQKILFVILLLASLVMGSCLGNCAIAHTSGYSPGRTQRPLRPPRWPQPNKPL